MKYDTPENNGISTEYIKEYINKLENAGLATHSVIIAHGENIVFEKYWKPFDRDFCHRLYSVSKSLVSLAVGFCEQEGLINLDDTVEKYFEDELKNQKDENMRNQTIRDMLMMCTAKLERNWFQARCNDRVRFYFENDLENSRPSGTIFSYDSTGSFVLGALVERVSGENLTDFLQKRLFDALGITTAYCLHCPGGHSWGDSGFLMRPVDLLKIARFVMNGGKWNGVQILNEDYITKATAKQVERTNFGEREIESYGYGYQIWRTRENSFFFNGMGQQLAVCMPEKDMILVYTGDNQGYTNPKSLIMDGFFDIVYKNAANHKLPPYVGETLPDFELFSVKGKKSTEYTGIVNGKKYILDKNPMDITEFELSLNDDEGEFKYTNKTGEKCIKFGICKNVFSEFPEEGYSDDVGTVSAPGHKYKCAASAAWCQENQLFIRVQIIDKYFGNLSIALGFKGEQVGVRMFKNAEDFLNEYNGYANGRTVK